jgi:hypothetical protein
MGDRAIKVYTEEACNAEGWLRQFYNDPTQKSRYYTWVEKEQTKLGWEDIFAHKGLYKCLLKARTIGFDPEQVLAIPEFDAFKAISSEPIRWQKGCEIYKKFIASNGAENINIEQSMTQKIEEVFKPGGVVCQPQAQPQGLVVPNTIFVDARNEAMSLVNSGTYAQKKPDPKKKPGMPGEKKAGLPGFMTSEFFRDCLGSASVEAEIRSFDAISRRFCQDEAQSYSTRPKKQKKQTRALIKTFWRNACKKNPNYDKTQLAKPTEVESLTMVYQNLRDSDLLPSTVTLQDYLAMNLKAKQEPRLTPNQKAGLKKSGLI